MAGVWGRPLKVGKVGYFIVKENPEWLGTDTIKTAAATTATGAEVIEALPDNDRVVVTLRGVSPGLCKVHVDYETQNGHTDCYEAVVKVVNC